MKITITSEQGDDTETVAREIVALLQSLDVSVDADIPDTTSDEHEESVEELAGTKVVLTLHII